MQTQKSWLRGSWLPLVLFLIALAPRTDEIGRHLPEYFHPDEDKEMRRAI